MNSQTCTTPSYQEDTKYASCLISIRYGAPQAHDNSLCLHTPPMSLLVHINGRA